MILERYRQSNSSPAERDIIATLRASYAGKKRFDISAVNRECWPQMHVPLATLARFATVAGYEFRAIDAPHATQDELKLVGWLAQYQRERSKVLVPVDAGLQDSLKACAEALSRVGIRLPYQAVLSLGFLQHQTTIVTRPTARLPHDPGARRHTPRGPGRNSLKAKAIAYAREHGCVSTRQFADIGISRQYLARLRVDGDLTRVRHAYYRAPDRDETALSAEAP